MPFEKISIFILPTKDADSSRLTTAVHIMCFTPPSSIVSKHNLQRDTLTKHETLFFGLKT